MNDKPAKKAEAKEELPAEIARAVLALKEDRWQLKEHRNPGHWICVPAGVTIEDVLQPAFWANVARKLKPSNTIEVHWDDASQFAEVYCVSAGRNWASVSLLRHVKLERAVLPQQASQYQITFNGPVDKFRIMRLSDNAVIRAGFASELEARQYLDDYLRRLAA
jgi:hypothetical protein